MAQLKLVKIEGAPDDSGRLHVVTIGPGTLRNIFSMSSGDWVSGTASGAGGAFDFSLYDNATTASGELLFNWTLAGNASFPLEVDFQNGLTVFVRSHALTGFLVFVFE